MNTKSDASTHLKYSTSSVGPARSMRKLTAAQRRKYNREIAIYRGVFGGTDIAIGDVEAWAALRATVPEMAEVDRKIAAFRRWEGR